MAGKSVLVCLADWHQNHGCPLPTPLAVYLLAVTVRSSPLRWRVGAPTIGAPWPPASVGRTNRLRFFRRSFPRSPLTQRCTSRRVSLFETNESVETNEGTGGNI